MVVAERRTIMDCKLSIGERGRERITLEKRLEITCPLFHISGSAAKADETVLTSIDWR